MEAEVIERQDVALSRLRRTTALVLAQAVCELFPSVELGDGQPSEDGFYYDFRLPHSLVSDDLIVIEQRMRRIIAGNAPITQREIDAAEAQAVFNGQPFKLEIVDELVGKGVAISTCSGGGYEDLCPGPLLNRSGDIPSDGFALHSVSGAYWRGDERRPMLQRIHGTVWPSVEDLRRFQHQQEQAKQRDHRTLGRDLDLFSISDAVGPGLILWHPRGATLRIVAEEFVRAALTANGYQWVFTPHIGRSKLWKTSGHLSYFGDEMYPVMESEGEEYFARPMNCPFHAEIYKSRARSYRDLPIRLVEFGTVYRYERSGTLHGMSRVRGATIDDTHIFCRPDQIANEIDGALDITLAVLQGFGVSDFRAELSTKPTKAIGDDDQWDIATDVLRRAAVNHGLEFLLDEGGGAFYGPKLSVILRDAIGRDWQCSTIQFDFNLPQRFDLVYVGEDNAPHRPFMVHRAVLGSIERFVAVLIEHFGGDFPLWLAPVQAVVIPISPPRHGEYAETLTERLRQEGIRVEIDAGNERMQARIRRAELLKIPVMLVVGDRELESETVSRRSRTNGAPEVASVSETVQRLVFESRRPVVSRLT